MRKQTLVAMLLALLIPGAGHLYLARRTRAIVFFCVVLFMFIAGLVLDGKLYVADGRLLTLLATLGSMGAGILYGIARVVGTFGDLGSPTYEYGTAFTLTAGLMNLLLVLDAFDISEQRKS